MHATATEILPGLWVGTEFSCVPACELGYTTLCLLRHPCGCKNCHHIPLAIETPLGAVEGVKMSRINEAVDWIRHNWSDEGRRVLVHCAAGIERSPLVMAHFLASYFSGVDLDEAYAWIRKLRPIVQDRRAWIRDDTET